jgi:starch phosphorylase
VELCADGVDGGEPIRQEMNRLEWRSRSGSVHAYTARVAAARPATDYTPRIIVRTDGAAVPLEAGPILWQR